MPLYDAEMKINKLMLDHQAEHGFHNIFDYIGEEVQNLIEEIRAEANNPASEESEEDKTPFCQACGDVVFVLFGTDTEILCENCYKINEL